MAKADVYYECKATNQSTYSSGNTVVDLYDISREAVRDFLLSRNPNWADVRIKRIVPR